MIQQKKMLLNYGIKIANLSYQSLAWDFIFTNLQLILNSFNQIKIIMIRISKTFKLINFFPIKFRFQFSTKKVFEEINQSSLYRPIMKVQDFIKQHRLAHEIGEATFRLKQCPYCNTNSTNSTIMKTYTLNVDKKDGKFLCYRCNTIGSWEELRSKLLNIKQDSTKQLGMDMENRQKYQKLNENFQTLQKNIFLPEFYDVLTYVKSRGFTEETILKYRVGAGTETFFSQSGELISIHVIYFPMFKFSEEKTEGKNSDPHQQLPLKILKIKVRGASSSSKKYTRQHPSGPESGFFGLNTVEKNAKIVVITQGQFDAMAVNQQTGYTAISLPQGANSFPSHLISTLNQFQKIVLWMDNDQAGKLGSQKISHKLGQKKVFIVKHSFEGLKDANDFLLKSPSNMKDLIEKSKTKPGQNILNYEDIKSQVRERIMNYETSMGITIDSIPFLSNKIKGIRMQELSIISGPTGSGKTTFLSQLTVDLCKKNIPVLWGSFQIRNQVLLTNMLIQYSQVNLTKSFNLFDHYAESFRNLPFYCLSFHGSNDINKVLATIQYAIQKHGISFVVIDTLQFLLSDQADGPKKFDLQDKLISRLRKIATEYNVHVALVIHPRKTLANEDLQIASIYGTSKAAQEADNIWIVQSRQGFRILDIKKNRFDGQIGKIAMGYDKQYKTFFQLTRGQLQSLFAKQLTINEILVQRKASKQAGTTPETNQSAQASEDVFTLDPQTQDTNQMHEDLINLKKKKWKKSNE